MSFVLLDMTLPRKRGRWASRMGSGGSEMGVELEEAVEVVVEEVEVVRMVEVLRVLGCWRM